MKLFLEIKWHYIFNPQLAFDSLPFVLEGLGYTLLISFISFCVSLVLGTTLALMQLSQSRILHTVSRLYISLFRGVPIIVTLFFLYFGLPFIGITFTALQAALIGFGLTSSAYSSEIIRASISSVDSGQYEAAFAIGMRRAQVMRYIVLPQSVKVAIPPLSNVMLDLVKGSSVAAMITVPEIFQKAKIVGGSENDYMTMYLLVAAIYWAICTLYGKLQQKLEHHFTQE